MIRSSVCYGFSSDELPILLHSLRCFYLYALYCCRDLIITDAPIQSRNLSYLLLSKLSCIRAILYQNLKMRGSITK